MNSKSYFEHKAHMMIIVFNGDWGGPKTRNINILFFIHLKENG
jgi:hypothetical protein